MYHLILMHHLILIKYFFQLNYLPAVLLPQKPSVHPATQQKLILMLTSGQMHKFFLFFFFNVFSPLFFYCLFLFATLFSAFHLPSLFIFRICILIFSAYRDTGKFKNVYTSSKKLHHYMSSFMRTKKQPTSFCQFSLYASYVFVLKMAIKKADSIAISFSLVFNVST